MSSTDHSPALPDGVITPLLTLMRTDGTVDAVSMAVLVEAQIASGIDALLVTGSTGELGTLAASERARVAEVVVDAAAARLPIWAGVAGLSTADAIIEGREMAARGVDALLVLPPMYFTHSDDEIYRHYASLREVLDVPLVAYDVPARTPQKLGSRLIHRLAVDGVLDGVKDSSGDLTDARMMRAFAPRGSGFKAYAGTEITVEPFAAMDFNGIVPGFANFAPAVFAEEWRAATTGDRSRAWELSEWVAATFPILHAPWPEAGGLARAIGALKEATAWALDLPPQQPMGAPLTTPPAEFHERVVEVLEGAMGKGTVDHVAIR